MNILRFVLALVSGFTISAAAEALPSLIGDAVTVTYRAPTVGNVFLTDEVTVGAEREIACPGAFNMCTGQAMFDGEYLDLGELSISGAFVNPDPFPPTSFAGFAFEGLDFGSGERVVGFSLVTNIPGLTASNISFTDHAVFINLAEAPNPVGDFVLTLSVAVVPEPEALALLAMGLVTIGGRVGMQRRRVGTSGRR